MQTKYWFLLLLLIGSANALTPLKVVAIDHEGYGRLLGMDVEIVPGKGRLLLSSLPFTGIDTQLSERQAVDYALRTTGQKLGQRDIIFTFNADVELVEGQSAGAAMALGVLGELQGVKPRQDVVVTGAIDAEGNLIGVSGVLEKAMAAGENGVNILVVPSETSKILQTIPKKKILRGIGVQYGEPVVIDLVEYAQEHWGLEVFEANHIDEVIPIVFSIERSVSEKEIKDVVLKPRQERSPLTDMGEDFLHWAENLDVNESELAKAREYLSDGHEYAGANDAFLAWADAKTDMDLELLGQSYFIDEEFEVLEQKLNLIKIPEGYNIDTINWHVGAQQRYVWALERLDSIRDAELDPEVFAYNLNLIRGWLHISEEFLKHVEPGNLTFSSDLPMLVNELSMEANEEIVAALILNQDTFGSFPLINGIETHETKGWYFPAGYDAINAKVRASSFDSKTNPKRTIEALDGLEAKIAKAKMNGLGFWPDVYYDGAQTAIVEEDYMKAYVYASMASEFAEYELEAIQMQGEVPIKMTLTEEIVRELKQVKTEAEKANVLERVVEKIFGFLESLVAK